VGHLRLIAAVVAVALVTGGGYWATTLGGESNGATDAADMEHIHGLGVDPADGVLYAGTHHGLFRIDDNGEATQVADRVQDFMGFAVAGPGRFLASGHPGAGQSGPGALGLIESTDGGESWTALSLAGDADFHSLEFRHDRVYGLNAMTSELMVSSDLEDWEPRGQLPIADFAVSPTEPETILVTAQEGPALSTDGGSTFRRVADAPIVFLVSWADDGTIVALTPDGDVYTSADQGVKWVGRGSIGGAPEALTAVSRTEIYAASQGKVLASRDGGDTFTTLHPR
jgi:photosystem II stability/assembly factor-like uncharacterized protein